MGRKSILMYKSFISLIFLLFSSQLMGQQAMVIEAIQAGARYFIVKPFKTDRVLEAVRKAVG